MSIILATIAIALVIGGASGAIGSFIVSQRLALVGDALSHVALPGIALALAYNIDPFWGVLVFLIAAAVAIWLMEKRSAVPPDALVGILFTASLAIGVLTIPDHEIFESLFGAFPALSLSAMIGTLAAALTVAALAYAFARRFLALTISPDLAHVEGIGDRYRLVLFLLFALIVALGIKLVGTLLMGALTIIPAAVARNCTRSMRSYLVLATIMGSVTAVVGVIAAQYFGILPGPTIILFGVALFVMSLLVRRDRTQRSTVSTT